MKYASDNRFVQGVHALTTGPYRYAFYLVLVVAVCAGLYPPLRSLYSAYRTNDILQQQVAIRKQYNDALEGEVNQLLSKEGIEAAAREQGMVMPGEKTITVEGADIEDDEAADDPDTPSTSAEVEAAERAVMQNTPWYLQMLDALFFYDGTGTQAVVSSGSGSSAEGE